MQDPPWPDGRSALFFDLDGTLAPLQDRPEDVCIGPATLECVAQWQRVLGGAVAILSGRPLEQIDRLISPLRAPAAGVHGAERRDAAGIHRRIAPPDLAVAQAYVEEASRPHAGLRLEVKPGALALHYRLAPQLEGFCITTMAHAQQLVEGMSMLHGKMVVELKPRRAGKGHALRAFLDEPPFRGRRPWMFGDDVTDEAAFEAALEAGGVAVKVGPGDTIAPYRLAGPAELHEGLCRALEPVAR